MNKFLAGAVAGCVATAPMTLAMVKMHQQLPAHEQYPLPPREIIEEVTEKVNLNDDLNEKEKFSLTMLSHFGYGAATGAIYNLGLEKMDIQPSVANGVVYGLGVWSLSYLGLLPATNILSSATHHPARRNALMIAAHVVFGATLGATARELQAK